MRPALLALPLVVLLTAPLGAAHAAGVGEPPSAEQRAAAPDAGAVRNVLPPGSRGNYTATDVAAFQADGRRPENTVDQLALYDALNRIAPQDVTPQVLQETFKEAALGVDPDDVVATLRPREGVTVLRDRFGVPHVYGVTDADTAYGAGFAGTQDRMFLQDALRHVGAARLTEFLGPSPANIAMDRAQLQIAPYTVEEAEQQVANLSTRYPGEGEQIQERVDAFIEGVNAAQREACPTAVAPGCPAEYAALQVVPRDWTRADVIYVASLVGGIFGSGGGAEYDNGRFLATLQGELGAVAGRQSFDDLMAHDDPEAPTTIDQPFPYNQYGTVDPAAVAVPDAGAEVLPGTGRDVSALPVPGLPAVPPAPSARPEVVDGPLGPIELGLKTSGMSNALLVNANESENGHPIAVFGPQVGYFAPQILLEIDLHGPSYAARGAAFPGTHFVVQLGHGVDYAWSATSANHDNTDTVAEELCNADGSTATLASTSYLDADGACVPFDRYVHRQVAKPGAGGAGLPQVIDLEVVRSRHGIVQLTTLSGGTPVAYATQRTTYGGEFDSVVGFARINDPGFVRDAASFMDAFSAVDYTFNWFYVDSRDTAYYSSGLLPQRAPGVDPRLPRAADARFDWVGMLPQSVLPRAVNPPKGWMTSWNNKPAPGFTAADDQYGFGSIYRSLSLDVRLAPLVAGPAKASLAELTGAMIDAATVDPRAQQLLPEILAAVGAYGERAVELDLLRTWQARGGNRVDRDRDGAYADQAAIALLDAWWEDLARTVLRPVLGDLVDAVPGKTDDHPRRTPGGWNAVGWYGYVDKDLRQVLGQPVRGEFSRTYCGGGDLELCRADLRASLDRAAQVLTDQQGTADAREWTYDKNNDRIRSSGLGLVNVPTFDFQNRPTFQQVVSFTRSRSVQPAPPAAAPVSVPAVGSMLPATGGTWLLPALSLLLVSAALAGRRWRRAVP